MALWSRRRSVPTSNTACNAAVNDSTKSVVERLSLTKNGGQTIGELVNTLANGQIDRAGRRVMDW